MVSNGLSSRRLVLKRPIVCKSKPRPGCGACQLAINLTTDSVPVNSPLGVQLELICNPEPDNKEFMIEVVSAFEPIPPMPPLLPNAILLITLAAPGTPGEYAIAIHARNQNRCEFTTVAFCDVF